jgi:hypothetical protein
MERDSLNFPDYQREPNIWRPKDKQLLIDSILNDIDIPKLYFYKERGGKIYDVVDGQQRLWAIWEFIDNEYSCKIQGQSKRFKELDSHIQKKILSYELQITLITDVSDDYLRQLFLRLQLGLLLKTGEKLHAMTGTIRDFVFKSMIKHRFIKAITIPKRRYAKETLCAQICINSFSMEEVDEFSRTRYEDLRYFFEKYQNPTGKDLKFYNDRSKSIVSTLDRIDHYFKDNARNLRNRSMILSVYLFAEDLIKPLDEVEIKKTMPKFVSFIREFSTRLKDESKAGFERKNEELYIFESFLSNAPGEKYQIEKRHLKLKEFFNYYQTHKKIKGDR